MATDAYNVNGTDSFTTQGGLDFSKAAYDRMAYLAPVSYTHLTLPTIYSV